jgi:bifunctional non-homologous end joining protein LigD
MASKLAKYRSKRDFEKTQEPSGAAKVRAAEYPRFVIQKHDATRLHYDLRLEHDGVFKSWAVTKGPSLNPKDKRLAVEVEDHPLDYGDFEGTIPKGEYGGGTVMLWDRGYWLPEGNENIDEALKKGELKFVLAGGKLQGSWVLVRMKHDRDGGKRNNWLLIKHKDQWSDSDGEAALRKDKSIASGRTMKQIAEGKGKAPAPFMLGGKHAFKPDAVWNSRKKGEAPDPPAAPAAKRRATRKKPARKPAKPKAKSAKESGGADTVLGHLRAYSLRKGLRLVPAERTHFANLQRRDDVQPLAACRLAEGDEIDRFEPVAHLLCRFDDLVEGNVGRRIEVEN